MNSMLLGLSEVFRGSCDRPELFYHQLPHPVDDKRQVIYAALLRFDPGAMELRQRALERVVLSGLLGSTEEASFKVDKIQKNLKKRPQALELREELIRDTLRRLIIDGKVERFEQKSSKSYCLTKKGAEEINAALDQAVDIFDPVMRHMLEHTESMIPFESAATLCRAFIMECFGRFGRQIARSVMGRLDRQDLAKSSDLDLAFEAAVSGRKLSDEARESLYQRCVQFIRSSEPQEEQLKLRLTQGFFLAELLCIEGAPFDPLSTQAFKGAVFYLDTNVVFVGLLTTHNETALFGELLRLASRLGIELRITRATINEARRVVAHRRAELEKYLAKIPAELTDLTHDTFLSAYYDLEARDPELTPEQFFDRFDKLTEILEQDWGVYIDDRTEDEILGDRTFEREAPIIQEETNASRGFVKSDQVLRHDLAQLAVIRTERIKNPKTWLLTADRSLIRAASRLMATRTAPLAAAAAAGSSRNAQSKTVQISSEDTVPFCFSLAGFLQSISPFTASYGEERSLADIFSTLVTEYLSLSENLFDMKEMNLLMELHEDVMITPPEQLVPALDYLKSKVLHGRRYSITDLPRVALELKKFLSKSIEERQRALEIEAQRRADEVKREQRARAAVEEKLERERGARALDQALSVSKQWRDRLISGLILAGAFWFFRDNLVASILSHGLDALIWTRIIRAVVVSFAALSIFLPTLFFLRSVPWRNESKAVTASLILLAAIASSHLLNDATWSRWASWIEIAGLGGVIVYLIATRNKSTE